MSMKVFYRSNQRGHSSVYIFLRASLGLVENDLKLVSLCYDCCEGLFKEMPFFLKTFKNVPL